MYPPIWFYVPTQPAFTTHAVYAQVATTFEFLHFLGFIYLFFVNFWLVICFVLGIAIELSEIDSLTDLLKIFLKIQWRCCVSKTKDCTMRSIRIGSWFQDSRVPMIEIWRMFLMSHSRLVFLEKAIVGSYCKFRATSIQIEKEIKANHSTVVDFCNYFRELCYK